MEYVSKHVLQMCLSKHSSFVIEKVLRHCHQTLRGEL